MTTIAVSYNQMSYYLIKNIAWETFRSAGEIHAPYRIIDPHSTLLGRLAETGIGGGGTLVLLLGGFVWLGVKATQT